VNGKGEAPAEEGDEPSGGFYERSLAGTARASQFCTKYTGQGRIPVLLSPLISVT
jgi:hypothetical protein